LNYAQLPIHAFLRIVGCKLLKLMPWLLMAFAAPEIDVCLQSVTKLGTDVWEY
jgi:hypothetical protein